MSIKKDYEYKFNIGLEKGQLEIFAKWTDELSKIDLDTGLQYECYLDKKIIDSGVNQREAFWGEQEDYIFDFLVYDILERF